MGYLDPPTRQMHIFYPKLIPLPEDSVQTPQYLSSDFTTRLADLRMQGLKSEQEPTSKPTGLSLRDLGASGLRN